MRLPWTKRYRLDKALKRTNKKLNDHIKLHYHLAESLRLAEAIFKEHNGCQGIRCILTDIKGPIESLKRIQADIKSLIKVKTQSE